MGFLHIYSTDVLFLGSGLASGLCMVAWRLLLEAGSGVVKAFDIDAVIVVQDG